MKSVSSSNAYSKVTSPNTMRKSYQYSANQNERFNSPVPLKKYNDEVYSATKKDEDAIEL